MAKLIMMKGLPASGKTTKAKSMIKEYGNFVRVSRDDLRPMLHGDLPYSGRRESVTVATQKAIVRSLLESGQNVIVDDTNLTDSHNQRWSTVAKEFNAKFEVASLTDVTIEDCILRDLERENPVGAHVIYGLALQSHLLDGRFIVCDLDGTIADLSHRLHYIKDTPKDWDSFFNEVAGDTLIQDTWNRVYDDLYSTNSGIIFVSARPERTRADTEKFLYENLGCINPILLMRQDWDRRDDTETKKEIYDRFLSHLEITRVYDDRPRVINMWKDLGLDVVDVGLGVDF